MKNYFVTFFINRAYNCETVKANTKKEAESLIKKKYCKAILITTHTKLPATR